MSHAGVMGLIPEVMISPGTLRNWLAMGYGVDTFGYSRLVILDVDSQQGYGQGHVPGAFLLESTSADLWAVRSNGVTETPYQVATKDQMDDIIRRTDIGGDTVIVITGSDMTHMARAYFNFRYWGFSKQSLKVLNTTKVSYVAAGIQMQTSTPESPEPCQFTVCSLQTSLVNTVRAPLEQMIGIAEKTTPETLIIDNRPAEVYEGRNGSTFFNPEKGSFVVFEGHISSAVNQDYKLLLEPLADPDPGHSKELLTNLMKQIHLNGSETAYVYGRTGIEAAVTFLVLDGVLNWPAKIYDGGWLQWGNLAGSLPETGGPLDEKSPWRTDIPSRSESITYNKPNGFEVDAGTNYSSYAKQADDINRHDSAACGNKEAEGVMTPPAPGY